jgi:hypothetical protein
MAMSALGSLNSAASTTPRSSEGTISPGATLTTDMPISRNTSAAMPVARNFMPFSSAGDLIGFLNQPCGSGVSPKVGKTTTFIFSSFWSSSL